MGISPFLNIIFFFPILCFGQVYKNTGTGPESYTKLILNSTDSIPRDLPNGRYKLDLKLDGVLHQYAFHLRNGSVSGPFNHIVDSTWHYYGNYLNDSLWTFISDKNDTSFLVGRYLMWNPYDNRVSHTTYSPYKIPFEDDIYLDTLMYYNGVIASIAEYTNNLGISKETWWYPDGSKKSFNEKTKNFDIEIEFKNDSIFHTYLTQDSVTFYNSLGNVNYLNSQTDVFATEVYVSNILNSIFKIEIDKQTKEFSDLTIGNENVRLVNSSKGILIIYTNKRGKRKQRMIKNK